MKDAEIKERMRVRTPTGRIAVVWTYPDVYGKATLKYIDGDRSMVSLSPKVLEPA